MNIAIIRRAPFVLFFATLLSVSVVFGQSLALTPHDTINSIRTPANKKYLSARSVIVPASFIVYGFASLHGSSLHNVNKGISEEIQENLPSFKTTVDDYLKYAPTASLYILSVAGIKGRHELAGRTVILIMSSVVTAQVVTSLKHGTHQLRPDGSSHNSFPSGHTAAAFIGAEMMHQEFGFRSPWYSVAGYAMASGTAVLRVLNNRHWLSDVIAGAGLGILSTKFCYWLFDKIEKKKVRTFTLTY